MADKYTITVSGPGVERFTLVFYSVDEFETFSRYMSVVIREGGWSNFAKCVEIGVTSAVAKRSEQN